MLAGKFTDIVMQVLGALLVIHANIPRFSINQKDSTQFL